MREEDRHVFDGGCPCGGRSSYFGIWGSESGLSGGNSKASVRRSCNRVLVWAPQPFYEDRGTPIAVRQVLLALSQLGYVVDVVTYPIGREVEIGQVQVLRGANPLKIRSAPIGFSLRKIVLDLGMLPLVCRRLRKREYMCIHAVEEAAFPAVVLGRWFGVPVIYDMQSSLPEQLAHHRLFRWNPAQAVLLRCEKWLLTNAHSVMSSTGLARRVISIRPTACVREWSFFSEHRRVVPPEGDELRAVLRIPEGSPVSVYTGTFEEYQGLDALVAGIPAVLSKVPNAVFVLVGGNAPKMASLCRQAEVMGVQGSLRVIPRQHRERIPAFLALADVLVSPRLHGGNLPLKIFDYLAAKRPIVATDIPTHRELLNEDRAVLVKPEAQALADGIIRVLQNPEEAAALAEAARAYAEEQHGWKRFVNELEQVYSGIASFIDGNPADAEIVSQLGGRVSPLPGGGRPCPRQR
jgi:glycosyltransferase involved in cell wall biosynthesis